MRHSKIKLNKGFLCAGSEAHLRLSLPRPRTAPLLSALPRPHQCSNLRVLGEKFVLHLPCWQNKRRSWSRVRGKSKERKDNLIARPAMAALTMRVAKDNWTTVRWQQILLIFSLAPSHKLLLLPLAYFAFNFQSANYARVPQIWEEREVFTLEWRELGRDGTKNGKNCHLACFSLFGYPFGHFGPWPMTCRDIICAACPFIRCAHYRELPASLCLFSGIRLATFLISHPPVFQIYSTDGVLRFEYVLSKMLRWTGNGN